MSADVGQALNRLARAPGVRRIAVMPDVHLAHDVCIGTVLATEGTLFPAAVGGDIGCGVTTIQLNGDPNALNDRTAARMLSALRRIVPVAYHRDPAPWPDELPSAPPSGRVKAAARQLGTLGRGNHFLELQVDDENHLWLMVHSGSRGAGQAIRQRHVGSHPLRPLIADSPSGQAYLADMRWARAYAAANRDHLLTAGAIAAEYALGCTPMNDTLVDCDHNHVDRYDDSLWVHRKGAIGAEYDQPGLIPGSMGSPSFHTCGRGCDASLRSSSHGAGRVMDRSTARRRITPADLASQMAAVYYDHQHAHRMVDEAPEAYRDIGAVMRAQRSLTRIVRRVRPLLSYKGS